MGSSVHQTVSFIMVAKPLDIIIRQPTTETMNKMVEQMAQMVAPVKTTAWGGCHGSLALVLDDADYSSITKACDTSTTPVTQLDAINKGITATSIPLKILTFQEETKKLQKEFDLQEAVTNIGVQRIIVSIKKQYMCVFLASGYNWGTVMHEIPISSFPILMTSLPYPRTQ